MAGVVFTSDWPARLRALIFFEYSQSNWAVPLANAIGSLRGSQELLFAAVILLWSIDPVIPEDPSSASNPAYGVGRGVQLDRIGKLVNQARGAASDALYRLYLRARIRANKSSGGPEDIYGVFYAMLGSTATGQLLYIPGFDGISSGSKTFIFQIGTPISADEAVVALSLLGDSKDAGARAILEWQQQADAITLSTAIGTTVSIATTPGDLFIDVPVDTPFSLFPASGNLILDFGLGNQEEVTYTNISGTFILAYPGVVGVHAIGASVTLDDGILPFNPGTQLAVGDALFTTGGGGDNTLDLYGVNNFPSAGTVVIDEGLANEETIGYSSIAVDTLTLVGTLSLSHDQNASVIIKGSGGALAGAADV